jgi:DNA-binding MarR family transcriptional regulator
MHKTMVSRAVAELERRRWLTRRQDDADRRLEHLTLTKAGADAYRNMVPLAKAFEQQMLGRLTTSEQAALTTGLAALERKFG